MTGLSVKHHLGYQLRVYDHQAYQKTMYQIRTCKSWNVSRAVEGAIDSVRWPLVVFLYLKTRPWKAIEHSKCFILLCAPSLYLESLYLDMLYALAARSLSSKALLDIICTFELLS